MPFYKLHRFHHGPAERDGLVEDIRDVEAETDDKAIVIAQAVVAEPNNELVGIELRNATGCVLWSLTRGDMIRRLPGTV